MDEYGEVTGVGRGNATIRVTAKDGSGQSRTVNIQVQQQPTEIQLDNELVVAVGKGGKQINATVLPANANNKKLTYASSDPSIAKVNNSGYVTPVSAGTCYVTVASAIDPTVFSDILIVVNQPVTRITFDQNVITVNVNEQTFANWNTLPYDATDPSVSLSSSNERIFTVTQSGRITGLQRGQKADAVPLHSAAPVVKWMPKSTCSIPSGVPPPAVSRALGEESEPMKATFTRLPTLILALLLAFAPAAAARAEEAGRDGLFAELRTDRDTFAAGEPIHAVLTVRGTGPRAVGDLSLRVLPPEGYAPEAGSPAVLDVGTLAPGETALLDVRLVPPRGHPCSGSGC